MPDGFRRRIATTAACRQLFAGSGILLKQVSAAWRTRVHERSVGFDGHRLRRVGGGFPSKRMAGRAGGNRLTGARGSRSLSTEQARLLSCLAEHRGEGVDSDTLGARLWPDGGGGEAALRALVESLRELLGDEPTAPRIIVPAGERGYALIAHIEPARPASSSGTAADAPVGFAPDLARRAQVLVAELRRRHVFKVAGGYLVAAWIVLQVAETTFEPLHLPGWWLTALTIVAVIGLPIVTALAWSYEITSGGIVADTSGGRHVTLSRPRPRRSLAPWLVGGVAVMAGVTGLAWWRSIGDTPWAGSTHVPAFASVAVLPFVDMSPDGRGGGYLGDGLSEELSARLAQIRGLRVASRTSAFAYRDRNIDAREIGRTLGVRHVLEGSVRRAGDSLRVTVQLIDARDGFHVWSRSYDRSWRDLLLMQADIARSVTDVLEIMLAPEAGESFGRGRPRYPRIRALPGGSRPAAEFGRHEPSACRGGAFRGSDRDRAVLCARARRSVHGRGAPLRADTRSRRPVESGTPLPQGARAGCVPGRDREGAGGGLRVERTVRRFGVHVPRPAGAEPGRCGRLCRARLGAGRARKA